MIQDDQLDLLDTQHGSCRYWRYGEYLCAGGCSIHVMGANSGNRSAIPLAVGAPCGIRNIFLERKRPRFIKRRRVVDTDLAFW